MPYKGKRTLDFAIAVTALTVTAPLQVATALAIRITMGKPVYFRQTRPGLQGRPFVLIKFRTMRVADSSCDDTDDESRITRLGAFLRSTSLDELPTLLNVLRGEMSMVGPRPLLSEYVEYYTELEARRMEARPGVTGLAQISGRNLLGWEERFALDVQYVDAQSLRTDVSILTRTVAQVLRRRGVSALNHPTMPRLSRDRTRHLGDS